MMNKKVTVIANNDVGLYNFRKEVVERLLEEGNQVDIILPYGEKIDKLVEMGCVFHDVSVDRRGTNPIKDLGLLNNYRKLLKKIKPDVILTYTIKPNIYGGIVAQLLGIPYIPNITGLGSAVENPGFLQKFTLLLYKCALKKAQTVYFQNEANLSYLKEKGVISGKYKLLNGSGVNLSEFEIIPYPNCEKTEFVFIGRIMRDKGIEEYIHAAKEMKAKYEDVEFHICGFCEEKYQDEIEDLNKNGIIQYHGMLSNVRTILERTHCTVLPSYHEGMSNVLLESAASGRPVIASKINGCQETFEEGVSGYGVEVKSADSLIMALEKFHGLPFEEKQKMGLEGRKLMEAKFDREKIVMDYMMEIESIK